MEEWIDGQSDNYRVPAVHRAPAEGGPNEKKSLYNLRLLLHVYIYIYIFCLLLRVVLCSLNSLCFLIICNLYM